jgi:hypothetical protein
MTMKSTYTTKYYLHSLPSTVAGCVAAGAAISLLVRDASNTGFTLDHAMMPVLVFLTVLLGHEAWRALKEAKLISFVGFVLLAVIGSTVIVSETMGRRAESRDAKVSEATKDVNAYAALLANLDRANKLVAEAESWVASECKTGLGPKCRGVTFTRDQRQAFAEKLRKDAEAHKAPAPIDSKADRVAAFAALFGFGEAAVKKAVHMFEPFVLPLFLELGAIFLFGFGVRTRSVSVSTVSEPKALSFEGPYTDEEIEELTKVLNGMGQPLTNDEVAAALRISKSEASKRVQKAVEAGKVVKLKTGRFNQISLVA